MLQQHTTGFYAIDGNLPREFAPGPVLDAPLQGHPGPVAQNTYTGTSGDDVFTGTANLDEFDLMQGGNDTVRGKGESDLFYFGSTLTADDFVDGGIQYPVSYVQQGDTVDLSGDYSAGLTLSSHWIRGIETFYLEGSYDSDAAYSYNLTLDDSKVVDSDLLTVFFQDDVFSPASLDFNGSAEDEADMYLYTIASGTDHIVGGGGNDYVNPGRGGSDVLDGGSGINIVSFFNSNTAVTVSLQLQGAPQDVGGGRMVTLMNPFETCAARSAPII